MQPPSPIRAARLDDAPGVAACVAAAYTPWIAIVGAVPGPMRDDYDEVLRTRAVHVVEQDGRIVGVLVLGRTDEGFLLENVAVLPEFAGLGFGRALLRRAEHEALAAGDDAIVLYTHARMAANLALYRRIGYVEYARRQEDGLDRVYLRKQLAPVRPPA